MNRKQTIIVIILALFLPISLRTNSLVFDETQEEQTAVVAKVRPPTLPESSVVIPMTSVDLSPETQIEIAGEKPSCDAPIDIKCPGDEMTERGRNIRAVYIPFNENNKHKTDDPTEFARWVAEDLGVNGVVLNIRRSDGNVYRAYPQLPQIVEELKKRNIYVIARIVCIKSGGFKDKFLIWDNEIDEPWREQPEGSKWVSPYAFVVAPFIAKVATKAEEMGFDEVQLDYIRFPSAKITDDNVTYPYKRKKKPYQAIARIVREVDRAITIPLSIDVFGLAAMYQNREAKRLGQWLEKLFPYLDAISPMLYLANWEKAIWNSKTPHDDGMAEMGKAIRKVHQRAGLDFLVRPYLQGFELRADTGKNPNDKFDIRFIERQVTTAKNAGASGYIFWGPSIPHPPVIEVLREFPKK